MKLSKKSLGDKLLKVIRLDFKGSQAKFADYNDVDPGAVSKVIGGKIDIPHKNIMKFMGWKKKVPPAYIEG